MFCVYILYSPSHKRTYVGFTNDLDRRLIEHNFTATDGFTIRYRPWELIHAEYYFEKSEAMKREKFYKTGVGREIIKKFLADKLP